MIARFSSQVKTLPVVMKNPLLLLTEEKTHVFEHVFCIPVLPVELHTFSPVVKTIRTPKKKRENNATTGESKAAGSTRGVCEVNRRGLRLLVSSRNTSSGLCKPQPTGHITSCAARSSIPMPFQCHSNAIPMPFQCHSRANVANNNDNTQSPLF